MINILEALILLIIILIALTLISGVKITFKFKKDDEFKGCLKILILKKIKIYTLTFPSQKDNKTDKKRDAKKLPKLIKPCLKEIFEFVKEILKTLKIKKIQNHFIIGSDNFADTGMYIGIIWSFLSVINTIHENIKISAEPTFTKATLNGYGENEVEIYPLKIIKPTVKLLLNKDVRKLIRGIINGRN